jgi:hypothetical protein
LFAEATVTTIPIAIGIKFVGICIDVSFPVVAPFATVIVAVNSFKLIVDVTAPVTVLLSIISKPFSDRTGPVNVVFAILISS